MVNLSYLQSKIQEGRVRLAQAAASHPRRTAWTVLAPLALAILLLCAPVALAAVQLNYFNVISFPASVTLEWSTASEVNLAGFDIQCKLASEPDSAFHEIGYVRAKGGPNVGALYTFEVKSNIVPGTSYCWRLKEITTDGTPGEVIDRCGYGPMVTPTPGSGAIPIFTPIPVQTDAFGNPIVPTPTPAVLVAPAVPTDAFGNPMPPTPFPPTPFPGAPLPVATDAFGSPLPVPLPVATDAFGNPLPTVPPVPLPVATDAFGNPLPTVPPAPQAFPTDAFGSPLPTPVAPSAVPTDAFGNPLPTPIVPSSAVPTDPFGNPLTTPMAPSSAGETDAFGDPLPTPEMPRAIPTDESGNPLPVDPLTGAPLAAGVGPASLGESSPLAVSSMDDIGEAAAGVQVAAVTPTSPAYIIVTATPTPAPALLAPVLTPLPTATAAAQGIQLASALDGGQNLTQNLMLMLLCLTFSGAGGIGIAGLITSVMFMRARSSQRDFYERTSTRRRL
jgi:hypothetical protein